MSQTAIELESIKEIGEEIELTTRVKVRMSKLKQDERLTDAMEVIIEQAGQEWKRVSYRYSLEYLDQELVLSQREGLSGKGIELLGRKRYTIKTIFGTVIMKRRRIRHKADGRTEIPSAKSWGTPRQIMISGGLRAAVCDIGSKQSYNSTVKRIEIASGEERLLSKSSIKNIIHAAGQRLADANEERAGVVYQSDKDAALLLGRAESYLAEEFFEEVYLDGNKLEEAQSEEDLLEIMETIEWDPRELISKDSQSGSEAELVADATLNIEPLSIPAEQSEPIKLADLIIVEPDEVVVRSQEAGKQWLINYAAVVKAGDRKWYVSASSSPQLFYQVGSLLSSLGLDSDNKQLLVISDGAGWRVRR